MASVTKPLRVASRIHPIKPVKSPLFPTHQACGTPLSPPAGTQRLPLEAAAFSLLWGLLLPQEAIGISCSTQVFACKLLIVGKLEHSQK